MLERIKKIFEKSLAKKAFRKHKNSLPKKTQLRNPKMDYHVLADAIVWEDEGISECHPELENAFRYVLNYRTNLISNEYFECKNNTYSKTFELAKKYFPDWIGFNENRCTYNAELSERIKRIRKVSEWKIEKMFDEENESE